MQIGMIGLGRMGGNLVRRLMRHGHECVVFDQNPAAVAQLVSEGAIGTADLEQFTAALRTPRTAWIMVPAAFTGDTVSALADHFERGDIIIDGGNSHHRDDVDRAETLAAKGLHYVDIGTSGGIFGLERGFCLMIGGEAETVQRLDPIFRALAPGVDAAPRTPGRAGDPAPGEQGYLHCGPAGAGHFVKMVHNGIEYGLMAAYAEGLNILKHANVGHTKRENDAETAPLRDPEHYQFDFNLADVTELWRRGSVVASWLLDLSAISLLEQPNLERFSGRVSDSGEGRWTIQAAIESTTPAPVLTAALYQRFTSRGEDDFAAKVLSAMRFQFGGHVEKKS